MINYYLGAGSTGEVQFEITDVTGENKRTLTVPAQAGINRARVADDLRSVGREPRRRSRSSRPRRNRPAARAAAAVVGVAVAVAAAGRGPQGDPAGPGVYKVTMTVNGKPIRPV